MRRDELATIRADIEYAVSVSSQQDPTLLPELFNRCLAYLDRWSTGLLQGADMLPDPNYEVAELLRSLQVRATSGIPYGEPAHDPASDLPETPHWSEHR
jgi:hypothetical protein